MRRVRLAPALLVAALLGLIAPASAGAHAFLVRSEPADAASLATAPHELRLTFSDRVRSGFTRIEVRNLRGRKAALHGIRVSGHEVVAALPTLPKGTYSIDWTVLSVDDSHLSHGVTAFGVGTHVAPRADRDGPSPQLADVVLRWMLLTLMAVAVGAVVVGTFVLRGLGAEHAHDRTFALAARAAVAAVVVGAGILVWEADLLERTTGGGLPASVGTLLESRFGATWAAREAMLVLLAALALLAGRRPGRGVPAGLAVAVVGGLAVAQALSGHANGLRGDRPAAVAADAAHLLAASVWVGGLVALVVALHGERREAARACWRRFGVLAGTAVGLIAVTGLYLASRNVASPDALLASLYGRTLLVKTLLLSVTGALGLASALALRARGRARGGLGGISRLTWAEAAAGATVLIAAGVLSAAAPPRGPMWAAEPPTPVDTAVRSAGDLVVSIGIEPNRPGENVYDVRVVSSRRPPPAPVRRVLLRYSAPDGRAATTPPLEPLGGGRYRLGGDELVREGPWRVTAVVERRGLPVTSVPFTWTVGASRPAFDVLVSNRPIGGFLAYCSLVGLLGLLTLAAVVLLRRFGTRRLAPVAAHQRML